jgi:hypothetical protein
MPDFVDLHIHSDHSDGRQTPREIVDRAIELGLRAISITDHDVVSGCLEAITYARDKDIEVITGIELSAAKTDDDIHLLGYLFRPDDTPLLESLEKFRRIRQERGKKMVKRLAGLDIHVDFTEILNLAGKAAVGRPHLAEALVRHGHVSTYNEAFDRYLSLDGPVYVPKAKLTPAEAIELIHGAGGVAVMAHPILTDRDEMIEHMVAAGLDGIEIYHPTHTRAGRKRYRLLAKKYGLIMTGGSDSHNRKGRYGDIGDQHVPSHYLDNLKAGWQARTDRHEGE